MGHNEKSPYEQAGEAAFLRYKRTDTSGKKADGPGAIELFRAYVEHREATKTEDRQRAEAILTSLDGLSLNVLDKQLSELLRLQILEALDPIIRGLLDFCENQPEGKNQLSELRLLLQIDQGRGPNDNKDTQRRWAIEQLWIDAYLKMQETGQFRSENEIANDIARQMSVSSRTAKNHWDSMRKREKVPLQARWAKQIADRLKPLTARQKAGLHSAIAELAGSANEPQKANKIKKPRKSKYRISTL